MRKIAARYAFDGYNWLEYPLISLDDDNTILSINSFNTNCTEQQSTEYYAGILIPGLINAHTHTELSYSDSLYKKQNGIHDFIKHVAGIRNDKRIIDGAKLKKTYHSILYNGTVAIADIINSNTGLLERQKSELDFNLFYEFYRIKALGVSDQIKEYNQIRSNEHKIKLTPALHSNYAVSESNYSLIENLFYRGGKLTSIHYKESREESFNKLRENKLFKLYKQFDQDYTPKFKNNTFIKETAKLLNNFRRVLLVHNTFIDEKDIEDFYKWSNGDDNRINFVLCPRSNMSISGAQPDYRLLRESGFSISLGTDSLLSSPDLSVFNEMLFIHEKNPSIPLKELLSWISINPAKQLVIDKQFGSFEVGKRPGINLIEFAGLNTENIPKDAVLTRLV